MKPWERVSDNIFEFSSKDLGYEAVYAVQDPVLSKLLIFQVHELNSKRVNIPTALLDAFLACETVLEEKLKPQETEEVVIPPPPSYSFTENFIVGGSPLVGNLSLNFDFGFRDGDFERFKTVKLVPRDRYDFSEIRSSLDPETRVILCDSSSFLPTLTSFYRAVYPQATLEELSPIIQMGARYACFALPCLSRITDRGTLTRFWTSNPTQEDIEKSWELSSPSDMSFNEKESLPFEFLFADYRARGEKSPYFERVLVHTRRFFYGYQLFMTLTCFRMILSCVFSTPFKPDSAITRVFPDLEPPESLWNLFRSDQSLGFMVDESILLDFDLSDYNEELYSKILETYGHERIKQMWVNILGERLPTAAGLNVSDPKKTLSDIFDRRLQIHQEKDWVSFLDDTEFGLVWSIVYNTAPRIRHEYRRIMVSHFDKNGRVL